LMPLMDHKRKSMEWPFLAPVETKMALADDEHIKAVLWESFSTTVLML